MRCLLIILFALISSARSNADMQTDNSLKAMEMTLTGELNKKISLPDYKARIEFLRNLKARALTILTKAVNNGTGSEVAVTKLAESISRAMDVLESAEQESSISLAKLPAAMDECFTEVERFRHDFPNGKKALEFNHLFNTYFFTEDGIYRFDAKVHTEQLPLLKMSIPFKVVMGNETLVGITAFNIPAPFRNAWDGRIQIDRWIQNCKPDQCTQEMTTAVEKAKQTTDPQRIIVAEKIEPTDSQLASDLADWVNTIQKTFPPSKHKTAIASKCAKFMAAQSKIIERQRTR